MPGFVVELLNDTGEAQGYLSQNAQGVLIEAPIADEANFYKSRKDASLAMSTWIVQIGGDAQIKNAVMSIKLGA